MNEMKIMNANTVEQETYRTTSESSGVRSLLKIVSFLFLLTTFLVPLVVVPGEAGLTFIAKVLTVTTLVGCTLVAFLLNSLATGEIGLPRSKVVWGAFAIPLSLVIASLFSPVPLKSFFGNVFEVGTAGSFIILFFAFLAAFLVGGKLSIARRVVVASVTSVGIALFWLFAVIILSRTGLSSIANWPAFLAGSPIEFSIILGAILMLVAYLLSFVSISKIVRFVLWLFMILGLVVMGAVGFTPSFVILGVLSLMMFVYLVSSSGSTRGAWLGKSYPTLVLLAASIIFAISGSSLSGFLARTLNVSSLDVRPNLDATLSIIGVQWARNPITGSGPNLWNELWNMYKPLEVNLTQFWSTNFFFGSSLVLTLAATAGILALAALALFLFFFLRNGFKMLFAQYEDEGRKFLLISLFMGALSLWASGFVYNLGFVSLFFAFIFSGVFSALYAQGVNGEFRVNIFSNPKTNFISVFVVVLFMILTIGCGFVVWDKAVAGIGFNRALAALNKDSSAIQEPAVVIERSATTHNSDSYWRTLAGLYLLNVENIAAGIPANAANISEDVRTALQGSVGAALEAGRRAVAANPENYENIATVGRVYESLAVKGIEGAAASAFDSYNKALALAPNNPAIELALARIAGLQNDAEAARLHISKALEYKSNYTNAYFMLAQLEAATNNVQAAIRAIESATIVDPQNVGLYFQLGLVKYQTNDFVGAIAAFERAVILVPEYANARYFLGLSYFRLGRTEDSIQQFEIVKATNPDNTEVGLILENLKAGKDPFTGAVPPIDNRPEDRPEPPIGENS